MRAIAIALLAVACSDPALLEHGEALHILEDEAVRVCNESSAPDSSLELSVVMWGIAPSCDSPHIRIVDVDGGCLAWRADGIVYVGGSSVCWRYDADLIIAHEIGHAFGLDHTCSIGGVDGLDVEVPPPACETDTFGCDIMLPKVSMVDAECIRKGESWES